MMRETCPRPSSAQLRSNRINPIYGMIIFEL
jgi:hypothetical protein